MSIKDRHPEYKEFLPLWDEMDDVLKGEYAIKSKGEEYLNKTGGMEKNDKTGRDYAAYKRRARFPEITLQALTGMIGLIYEKDPVGETETIITNTGQSNTELSRDCVRAVGSKGRDILVIDAPTQEEGGGSPFIARYAAKKMINWKVDDRNPSEFTLVVLEEEVDDATDIYGHETETRYRRYQKIEGRVELSVWAFRDGAEEIVSGPTTLKVDSIPVIAIGSVDLLPPCDPLPLHPVGKCALSYYMKSATYENGLYLTGHPTPWVAEVNEEEYELIIEIGIGGLWHLGMTGVAGFLEITGSGLGELFNAMQNELKQAETYAVRLTQSGDGGVEAASSVAMRAATQHASIYSIADSVSLGIDRAQQIRAKWDGKPKPEEFYLRTEFTKESAGAAIIAALTNAINSRLLSRAPLWEAVRRTGLTEQTDEEMQDSIDNEAPPALPAPDIKQPDSAAQAKAKAEVDARAESKMKAVAPDK